MDIFYRREKQDMPAIENEVADAEAEGIRFHFLTLPTRINGDGKKVVSLEYQETQIKVDANNRRTAHPVPGSEVTLPVDNVIFAIGQTPDLEIVSETKGLQITPRNTIAVDSETMATTVPGIFAAGDAADMAGTVIEAIAAGKTAAESIDRFLQNQDLKENREFIREKASDIKVDIPANTQKAPRVKVSELAAQAENHEF